MKATKYGLPDFKELSTSTSTVMIYANTFFDIQAIFQNIQLTHIDVPLTKKQKNVDKDKIEAPYGAIISVQSKTRIRGINLKKKKKRWCLVCQPIKIENEKRIKIKTVTEVFDRVKDKKGRDTENINILHDCSKCNQIYNPEEQKKINHFLNQITIVLSLGDKTKPLLNIMMFKSSFKIVGCKGIEDAMEAVLILWQDYISKFPKKAWRLAKGCNNPRFAFETVMRNVGFKLGFPIERPELNNLMNMEEYSDRVFMSQYESSAHTNVNIKMFSTKPKNFKYECLVIPLDKKKTPFVTLYNHIPYRDQNEVKKKKIQGKYTTFIVFSSSETILSGKYDENMEEMYNFFVTTAFKNRKWIEESLSTPDQTEIEKITRRR